MRAAADDRTGALETAAALADHGAGTVTVTVWPRLPVGHGVVDLASRHLAPSAAVERAAALDATFTGHKIDSTLRGNWAVELAARHRSTDRPVLLVPALPTLGRTCMDGVVMVDGVPVDRSPAGADPRAPVTSSRPAEHLARCGVEADVAGDIGAVASWLVDPHGICVADAADDATVAAIVRRWRATTGVLLAGTSAVIGLAAGTRTSAPRLPLPGSALVVSGSAHPRALAQIDGHLPRQATVLTPEPGADSDAVAAELATRAHALIATGRFRTLVVIGGDTAAAVLGAGDVVVHGSAGPGAAVLSSPVFDGPVVTRAGGFGDESALADLLSGTLRA